jgi:hypothetical protein
MVRTLPCWVSTRIKELSGCRAFLTLVASFVGEEPTSLEVVEVEGGGGVMPFH